MRSSVQVLYELVVQFYNSYVEVEIYVLILEDLGIQLEESGAIFYIYLEYFVQGFQKEVKEKFKGWVTCFSIDNIDFVFKKVILGVGKNYF